MYQTPINIYEQISISLKKSSESCNKINYFRLIFFYILFPFLSMGDHSYIQLSFSFGSQQFFTFLLRPLSSFRCLSICVDAFPYVCFPQYKPLGFKFSKPSYVAKVFHLSFPDFEYKCFFLLSFSLRLVAQSLRLWNFQESFVLFAPLINEMPLNVDYLRDVLR